MLSNISDLFTMASLVICMLLSGIIFYYLRTRISMLEQSVMDQAQLLQQVVTSLKSSQYRQQMNANGGSANINMISSQQFDAADSNTSMIQKPMNLIQVSDDSDEDESDDDSDDIDDDDDSESETSQSDDVNMDVCTMRESANSLSKIIDLSAITSSSNSFKPYSPSQSEIKVIELKSNIHSGHDGDGDDDVTNSSDDDDDDDSDGEYDEDEYSDDEASSHDGSDKQMKKNTMNENNEHAENQNQNQIGDHDNNSTSNNNSINNHRSSVNSANKTMKSIVIEDVTNSVSLDEMKNMPVNSLRSLAKTKLSNIDVPTINKMSKKEILKALHD